MSRKTLADKNEIERLLKLLEAFPKTRTVRKLRSELKLKLARVQEGSAEQDRNIVPEKKRNFKSISNNNNKKKAESNIARSVALKKHHQYIRLIRDNYPELPYLEIRRLYKDRKKGKDTSIPDAIWFNPSP
jgi:hypothetical protein